VEACKAKNSKGEGCKAPPQKGRRYCYIHDPARKEDREASRRLGGHRRKRRGPPADGENIDLSTVAGIRDLLTRAARNALALDPGAQQVRSLVSVVGQAVILFEKAELAAELTKIKAALGIDGDGDGANSSEWEPR
jgi:hypothetical protein